MVKVTDEMQRIADEAGHYARELLAGKAMWGADYKVSLLGVDVDIKRVGSFAELAALKWCEPEAAVLDAMVAEQDRLPAPGDRWRSKTTGNTFQILEIVDDDRVSLRRENGSWDATLTYVWNVRSFGDMERIGRASGRA